VSIAIGTSGWNYPTGRGTWNGVFYPPRRARGFDELAWYAEHFDTVEVNSTFYRMPEAANSLSWLRRTPASFEFSVKLFQKFTHPDMYLAREGVSSWDLSRADVDLFRLGVDPLAAAGRLAAVLVQFPPSFHAEPAARDYLAWLLGALRAYPLAVELRHRTWSDDAEDTAARLAAHGAAWVLIDEPKFRDSVKQVPRFRSSEGSDGSAGSEGFRTPEPRNLGTSGTLYMRLHGRNAANWWAHDASEDRYNYLYSAAELQPFADQARAASKAGRRVLLYMNNHFSAKAVANAAVLKHQVGQPVPGEYPQEMVDRYPELSGIVTTSGLPL
jgi:uncharacterized protein YecE (DUF72 family)